MIRIIKKIGATAMYVLLGATLLCVMPKMKAQADGKTIINITKDGDKILVNGEVLNIDGLGEGEERTIEDVTVEHYTSVDYYYINGSYGFSGYLYNIGDGVEITKVKSGSNTVTIITNRGTISETVSGTYIQNNKGTVETNGGMIANNKGTVGTNNGDVYINNGEVTTNSNRLHYNNNVCGYSDCIIYHNSGTISTNERCVYDNAGHIDTNNRSDRTYTETFEEVTGSDEGEFEDKQLGGDDDDDDSDGGHHHHKKKRQAPPKPAYKVALEKAVSELNIAAEKLASGELEGMQTIYLKEGNALDLKTMQILKDNPNLTLDFTYTYEGVNYHVVIPGGEGVLLDEEIPWYGPEWLARRYSVD